MIITRQEILIIIISPGRRSSTPALKSCWRPVLCLPLRCHKCLLRKKIVDILNIQIGGQNSTWVNVLEYVSPDNLQIIASNYINIRSRSWVRFPGLCNFLSQILLSQLVLNPLVYYQVKWFGQYPNILVIDYYIPGSGRAEMLLPWLQRHHSWGNQPQKSEWRQQTTTIVDIIAKSVEAEMLWWHQWWMCNLGTQYIQCSILFNPKTLL